MCLISLHRGISGRLAWDTSDITLSTQKMLARLYSNVYTFDGFEGFKGAGWCANIFTALHFVWAAFGFIPFWFPFFLLPSINVV